MAHKDFDSEERFTDVKLGFRPAGWPKIDLYADTKEDLFRSFSLFDMNGLGAVSIDSVKVALRALGHEIDAKGSETLKLMFPDGTIVFGDYLKLLSEWIFNIDQDLDVEKAFALFDTDGKGYIDFNDLRRVRDRLGYSQEINDAELIDMLIGSQVNDAAQELKEIYEDWQDKTRLRKGQGYATSVGVGDAVGRAETGPLVVLPAIGMHRRTSSENAYDPTGLTVDFAKFKRVLQLEVAPPEPI
ncbi:Centrin 1 [Echinococcus multilocularis]|uniref:Centrin 1 n=1 Tax=Echinococcus multilocularis TaxID=6211 RepID=A0A068YIC6_ECHMU|nr:Centrin 1 [Echinococcus multilocularis]